MLAVWEVPWSQTTWEVQVHQFNHILSNVSDKWFSRGIVSGIWGLSCIRLVLGFGRQNAVPPRRELRARPFC